MIAGEYVIVTTTEPIDREMSAQYKLTVTCSDHGQPVLSTTALIFVNVEDINDQRPVFSQSVYNASVKENSEPLEVSLVLDYHFINIFRFARFFIAIN